MAKLDVYNLGELGVNLTKSPIHHTDGELLNAQNAEFYNENGRAALRRRVGLASLNSSALAGSIAGLIGVPLVAPTERLIAFGLADGSADAVGQASVDEGASTAGFTLTPFTGLAFRSRKDDLNASLGGVGSYLLPFSPFRGVGYYAGPTSRPGRLLAMIPRVPQVSPPAARLLEVIQFPNADHVEAIWTSRDFLYAITRGTVAGANFVYQVDPRTGEAQQIAIGTAFLTGTENPFAGITYLGKQWIGTSRASQGRVHSARVGDTTWTTERTAAANLHTYTSFAIYNGNLYAATAAAAGTAAIIEQMTPAGTWTTTRTGSDAVNANYFDGLYTFNDELYAFYSNGGLGVLEAHKYNGSSWVVDEDLATAPLGSSEYVTGVTRTLTALYVGTRKDPGVDLRLLKRTTGGTWSLLSGFSSSASGGGQVVVI